MKRSAELDREIREALAQIPKKTGIKTRAQLDVEIDAILAGGLRAERYEVAQALGFRYPKKPPSKPKSLTGTNLFALTQTIVEHGPEFSGHVASTDYHHLKRALDLGYLEPVEGGYVKLTPEGREIVADAIIKDIERASKYRPQVDPREIATHQATLDKLERALAKLQR